MNFRHVFNQVFDLEWPIALGVFGAIVLALTVAVVQSAVRRRRGTAPSDKSDHHLLEGTYAVVLFGFAIFLAAYTAAANGRETGDPAKGGLRIAVTGYQWCWRFAYRDPAIDVQGTCADGSHDPVLVVPTGRPVTLTLTSTDVIHSFWVPELRFKQDAFPHHVNTITFTMNREGKWIGRCAEYCGDMHATMHFWLRAVSPQKFRQWQHTHAVSA